MLFATTLFAGAHAAFEMDFSAVCFDLESGETRRRFSDDQHGEATDCNVCVFAAGSTTCQRGVVNNELKRDCIMLPHYYETDMPISIETDCSDAMWIERVIAFDFNGDQKIWGKQNGKGWCMSTDEGTTKDSGSDAWLWAWANSKRHIRQGVRNNQCFTGYRFNGDGTTTPLSGGI